MSNPRPLTGLLSVAFLICASSVAEGALVVAPDTVAQLFPLSRVRLLPGPFADAAAANRRYLLAHDPDRLLAPFLREAGLQPATPPYPNWESMGLDGHTAGHYLSALAGMIASGNDPDGELGRRLEHMVVELERVQQANGNGYLGGVPGSRDLWRAIATGDVGRIRTKWVPWYNVHKTFAGLRDVCLLGERPEARDLLLRLGDWCLEVISGLSEAEMQEMLATEHGGMNEAMADLYTLSGDRRYLEAAGRFHHHAVIDPLMAGEDRLTGLHANTQIPKVVGLARIASLTHDARADFGARFFWDTVVGHRSVAFGGNSVSEHFNDPRDFSRLIEHREGPETCNTYNMLRLTETLFAAHPRARYADFYERALYNHLLASIDPNDPGYVYFTPLRPGHYRVYSQAEECFWCCVGTGMENPGRYGQFIYARDGDGLYVNLFIASELRAGDGLILRQENRFPFEPRSQMRLQLDRPAAFTVRIRHPWWVPAGKLGLRVNGITTPASSSPSSYAEIRRQWHNGDRIEVELPMRTTVDPLPDGSNWAAILYGPIVLAAPAGARDLMGERASNGRMAHVANGPTVPLDQAPCLLTTSAKLPEHLHPDPAAGALHFRLADVIEPGQVDGVLLEPFFGLHHQRYQMYWELTTSGALEERRARLAAVERWKADREAATLDWVAPGEQQSEVEHGYQGEGARTGIRDGRRWREGRRLQYTFDIRGAQAAELSVTYSGDDSGRAFDIVANDQIIASQELSAAERGTFIEKRYAIPATVLSSGADGRVTIGFVAQRSLAGGLYDVRLLKPGLPFPDGGTVSSGDSR